VAAKSHDIMTYPCRGSDSSKSSRGEFLRNRRDGSSEVIHKDDGETVVVSFRSVDIPFDLQIDQVELRMRYSAQSGLLDVVIGLGLVDTWYLWLHPSMNTANFKWGPNVVSSRVIHLI
jgi:hypothetical protein